MPKEIERKFLVGKGIHAVLSGRDGERIQQGYLPSGDGFTLRVRIKGVEAYLTLKGKRTGISCDEYEYSIPLDHAHELLSRYATCSLTKTRYQIEHSGHVWEVDVFGGQLTGLMLAELELGAEDEPFVRPPWVDREVSDDRAFSNAQLAKIAAALNKGVLLRARDSAVLVSLSDLASDSGLVVPLGGEIPQYILDDLQRAVQELNDAAVSR